MFNVGQIVKHISAGGSTTTITPVRVAKVWKNGVVQVAGLDGRAYTSTFGADGWARGSRSWSTRIEAMGEGETAESILAANAAKEQAAKDKADKARQDKLTNISKWWIEEGQAMWDARMQIPFMNTMVAVIHYSKHGERRRRLPFVVVTQRKDWRGNDEVELQTGGLVGTQYDNQQPTINAYCSSVRAATLPEALYDLTH